MNDRILAAIKKLKEQQDEMQVDFNLIKKQLDKSGNYYLQRLMRQMEEDISNYSIQDGYWYFNGRNTGIKAEGIDGKDGNIGPQGKPGRDGIDGKPGRDGKDGKQGPQGLPGKDGKNGRDGKDGKDGIDGKDAVIPTFKVGKVETSNEYGGANAKLRLGKDGIIYLDLTLPRGPQGFAGFDAKINGRNTLDIEAGNNITLEETEKGLKISASGGGEDAITDVKVNGESVVEEGVANIIAYQKPSYGIPKSDLNSSVQTSLGKADSALQEEQYTGTITSVKMNGTTIASSGEADLGTVITAHQDISGKEDKSNKVTSISSSSTNIQYAGAKAVYDLFNSDLLHYKGHVNSVDYLPSTGQQSAPVESPNYVFTSNSTPISNTSAEATAIKNRKTSTYPYVIGSYTGSSTRYNNSVRTTDASLIDGIAYIKETAYNNAYVYVHIRCEATKVTQIRHGYNYTQYFCYDDGTFKGLSKDTDYTVDKPGWFYLGEPGSSSYVTRIFSNLPSGIKFINCSLSKIRQYSGGVGKDRDVTTYNTLTNESNYTYAHNYDFLKFDETTFFASYAGPEPSPDAVENVVYTVGNNYDIYRCNSQPAWEHWSAPDVTKAYVDNIVGNIESLLSEV